MISVLPPEGPKNVEVGHRSAQARTTPARLGPVVSFYPMLGPIVFRKVNFDTSGIRYRLCSTAYFHYVLRPIGPFQKAAL